MAIAAGTLSPVALTEKALARVAALAPILHAFITVTADRARAAARQAEADLRAGRSRGPLHGIPYALKDIYDVAEVRTTAHSNILIDNVGGLTSPGGGFSTLTDEHWENDLRLNLLSTVRLDRALLPGMIEKKSGVIIHISSVSGKIPLWEINMAYAASKAALNSYSKALANEVASKGVRVLTVSPGGVATEPMIRLMEHFAGSSGATANETYKTLSDRFGGVPMGRMAEPEEVASLVGFLVSPAAAYLTSANYIIDGGAISVI